MALSNEEWKKLFKENKLDTAGEDAKIAPYAPNDSHTDWNYFCHGLGQRVESRTHRKALIARRNEVNKHKGEPPIVEVG